MKPRFCRMAAGDLIGATPGRNARRAFDERAFDRGRYCFWNSIRRLLYTMDWTSGSSSISVILISIQHQLPSLWGARHLQTADRSSPDETRSKQALTTTASSG